MKRGFQTPTVKHWCDGCDRDFVEDGKHCRACGKKQRRKSSKKEKRWKVSQEIDDLQLYK